MAGSYVGNTIDIEALVDLEQQYACLAVSRTHHDYLGSILTLRFYDSGYLDGVEHGKIHGSIEGRQLGREKGFEMWEELGFYEGFAKLWKTLSEHGKGKDNRVKHNASLLLDLIAQFPMENPSHPTLEELDIPKLFAQIRARYKVLCSILGVKPSLRASQSHASTSVDDDSAAIRQLKMNDVWAVEIEQDPGSVDYSF
ncbi:hypothetical protein ACEPAH_9515 [Sanghuangporus vaninii]